MLYPSVPHRAGGDRYRPGTRSIHAFYRRIPGKKPLLRQPGDKAEQSSGEQGQIPGKQNPKTGRRPVPPRPRAETSDHPLVKAFGEYHLIHDRWTPEGIAGRFPLDFPGLATTYESIYWWIYTERRDLITYLVRGHKKRHTRPSGKKSKVSKTPHRVDLTERPANVELRARAGHGEVDTVVSRQSKACVAVLVEGKTRFFLVIRMNDKTASALHEAVTRALSGLPGELRKTITHENGLEKALHERRNSELGVRSYCCKPYHRWEKGSIENRNGILRRYFPKKHNRRLTTQKEIDKVVNKINAMPMKCLVFKTPAEVFAKCGGVALAD